MLPGVTPGSTLFRHTYKYCATVWQRGHWRGDTGASHATLPPIFRTSTAGSLEPCCPSLDLVWRLPSPCLRFSLRVPRSELCMSVPFSRYPMLSSIGNMDQSNSSKPASRVFSIIGFTYLMRRHSGHVHDRRRSRKPPTKPVQCQSCATHAGQQTIATS